MGILDGDDIVLTNPLTGDVIYRVTNPIVTAQNMYNSVREWTDNLTQTFSAVFGRVGEWMSSAVSMVTSIPSRIIAGLTGTAGDIASSAGSGFSSMVQETFSSITNGLSDALRRLWDGIASLWRRDNA